jgi:hypothetical protein
VSIFETDNVEKIAPILARYRVALRAEKLVHWIAEYLTTAWNLGWSAIPRSVADRLKLGAKFTERLAPVISEVRSQSDYLEVIGRQSPLLAMRVSELADLLCPIRRCRTVQSSEKDLRTILPWVHSVRHSVAHLGVASTTSWESLNQHLGEDVSLVYDQVMASALRNTSISISEIHSATLKEFDPLMESVLTEPCISVLHVRQGMTHVFPAPAKRSWQPR